MIVDREKCIGCTLCKQDCPVRDIEMVDGKAYIKNERCIKCGHCIAICPVKAVSSNDETEYSMDEVMEYDKESFEVNADNLMNFMKFRRSVRLFKDQEVEEEKIQKIIEAGRYTQTGSNAEDVSYIIVKDKIEEVKKLALQTLDAKADEILSNENSPKYLIPYANMWKSMYKDYLEDPKNDRLFFNAPLLIVVKADRALDAGLAAAKMELMTDALGLGTFFNGFLERATVFNPEVKKLLQLGENEELTAAMLIGYPRVQYKRTVPRKQPKVKRI